MSMDGINRRAGEPEDQEPASDGPAQWREDTRGRQFTAAVGRSGVVYRQGEESVEEAHERDAQGKKDVRPKKRTAKKQPAPTKIDMRELEHGLVDLLRSPAFLAAAKGDEWAAMHFTNQAPNVARNLVTCAEHNPWLREKLVTLMVGEGPLVNVMLFASLGVSIFSYAVPPIVWYFNPGIIPESARMAVRMQYQMPMPPPEDIPEEFGAPFEAATFAASSAPAAG